MEIIWQILQVSFVLLIATVPSLLQWFKQKRRK